jgi:hypothetical protein
MFKVQLIALFLVPAIIFSFWLVIILLNKVQRRSLAHDLKITDKIEQNTPFSL